MSIKMKKLTLIFCLFSLTGMSYAQEYKAAIGARLGSPLAASIKYFANESNALEAYVGTRGFAGYRWTSISGAYLRHAPIEGVDGLQYYFGAGASVFFWNFDFSTEASTTTLGLQGYLGLDYKIPNLPISITADWVPTYFLNAYAGIGSFGSGYGALGIRYVLAQ